METVSCTVILCPTANRDKALTHTARVRSESVPYWVSTFHHAVNGRSQAHVDSKSKNGIQSLFLSWASDQILVSYDHEGAINSSQFATQLKITGWDCTLKPSSCRWLLMLPGLLQDRMHRQNSRRKLVSKFAMIKVEAQLQCRSTPEKG